MSNRILWNRRGGEIDELVITNPTAVHIEQMDDDCWWIGINTDDGGMWMGNFYTIGASGALTFTEQDNEGVTFHVDATHEVDGDE